MMERFPPHVVAVRVADDDWLQALSRAHDRFRTETAQEPTHAIVHDRRKVATMLLKALGVQRFVEPGVRLVGDALDGPIEFLRMLLEEDAEMAPDLVLVELRVPGVV